MARLSRALAVLDGLREARDALETIVSGSVPEAGPYSDEYYGEYASGAATGGGAVVAGDEHRSVPGLELEILALRRGPGELVTLKLAVANGSGGTVRLDEGHQFGFRGPYRWSLEDAGLIDLATGDRYGVMRDSQGNCVCSTGGYSERELAPGERRLQARFAGVLRSLRTVKVDLPGGFPLVDGVTIGG